MSKFPAIIIILLLFYSCDSSEKKDPLFTEIKSPDSPSLKKFDITDSAEVVVIKDSVLLQFEELRKELPEIRGYKRTGAPSGESYARRTSGGIVSYAMQDYKNIKNDERSIHIEIMDYTMSPQAYQGLFSMYRNNQSSNNENEIWKKYTTHDSASFTISVIYKRQNESKIIKGINGRYMIIINAYGSQDTDLLMQLSNEIDPDSLANKNLTYGFSEGSHHNKIAS